MGADTGGGELIEIRRLLVAIGSHLITAALPVAWL